MKKEEVKVEKEPEVIKPVEKEENSFDEWKSSLKFSTKSPKIHGTIQK